MRLVILLLAVFNITYASDYVENYRSYTVIHHADIQSHSPEEVLDFMMLNIPADFKVPNKENKSKLTRKDLIMWEYVKIMFNGSEKYLKTSTYNKSTRTLNFEANASGYKIYSSFKMTKTSNPKKFQGIIEIDYGWAKSIVKTIARIFWGLDTALADKIIFSLTEKSDYLSLDITYSSKDHYLNLQYDNLTKQIKKNIAEGVPKWMDIVNKRY